MTCDVLVLVHLVQVDARLLHRDHRQVGHLVLLGVLVILLRIRKSIELLLEFNDLVLQHRCFLMRLRLTPRTPRGDRTVR